MRESGKQKVESRKLKVEMKMSAMMIDDRAAEAAVVARLVHEICTARKLDPFVFLNGAHGFKGGVRMIQAREDFCAILEAQGLDAERIGRVFSPALKKQTVEMRLGRSFIRNAGRGDRNAQGHPARSK